MKKIKKTRKGFILAEGEVTGHAHRVMETIELFDNGDGEKIVKTENPFTITHEEHAPAIVDDCLLFNESTIGIVNEYDHFKEEARKVAD